MIKVLDTLGLKRLFLLAILIRLFIMPFYFHPDIKTYHFQAQFLNRGVFNIYDYLEKNKENLPIKEEFVYFPLTYFFLGSYQLIANAFLGTGFSEWLSDASQTAVNRIGVFRYLFILKLPYLILDLLIPFLLIGFFKEKKEQRKFFILWLFNPVSIVIIYIFSNVDIIPVILSLMSILLFRDRQIFKSALLLGISAGFKPFTLLLLPIFLLFNKRLKEAVKYVLTTTLTLGLIIIPFWSNAFFHSALLSGLTTRIAYPGISVGFGESLMIGVVVLFGFYFWTLMRKTKGLNDIWLYMFSLLLLLFSTIHFHVQWLFWVMPFLVIISIFRKDLTKLILLWLNMAFLIPILYNDQAMNVSLLSAISLLYTTLPTIFVIVQKIYDPYLLQSILHSIIFALSLILVSKIFRIEES